MPFFHDNVRPLFIGLLFALCSISFGFGMGGVFGAFEDNISEHLKHSANAVAKDVYKNDTEKISKIVKKSWHYLKRAHLHGGAIGTASLAIILLLTILPISRLLKQIAAASLGIGALGYSTFWLGAGLLAPSVGSTSIAKEALSWWSIPSAFLCLFGLMLSIICLALAMLKKPTQ